MNRRGLSDIIVTILIILLVLAGIVIMWAFIRPLIFTSGSQIDSGFSVRAFSIVPNSVSIDPVAATLDLSVRRDPSTSNPIAVVVTMKDINGIQKTVRQNKILEELEVTKININYGALGLDKLNKVEVSPVYSVNGKDKIAAASDSYTVQENGIASSGGSSGPTQTCGNNLREGTEVCDGSDLNSQTCATQQSAGYTGSLSCNAGCTAFVTTSCVAPFVMPSGMILRYDFESASGSIITDTSSGANNNPAVLNGGAFRNNFAGSNSKQGSYALTVNPVTLDFMKTQFTPVVGESTTEYTLMFWVRPVVTNAGFMAVRYVGAGSHSRLVYLDSSSKFNVVTTGATLNPLVSINPAIANIWQHVEITSINGGFEKLYINGVLQDQTSITTENINVNPTYYFGNTNSVLSGTLFKGDMDDIILFNRALTASEIQSVYNSYP